MSTIFHFSLSLSARLSINLQYIIYIHIKTMNESQWFINATTYSLKKYLFTHSHFYVFELQNLSLFQSVDVFYSFHIYIYITALSLPLSHFLRFKASFLLGNLSLNKTITELKKGTWLLYIQQIEIECSKEWKWICFSDRCCFSAFHLKLCYLSLWCLSIYTTIEVVV